MFPARPFETRPAQTPVLVQFMENLHAEIVRVVLAQILKRRVCLRRAPSALRSDAFALISRSSTCACSRRQYRPAAADDDAVSDGGS